MTVQKFEEKYGDKGGINKLTELRSLLFTQKYIANHFGVTKERARQWILEFFGEPYNPIADRRDAIMLNMVDFAKNNTKRQFDLAFRGTQYYREVLSICIEQKIYDTI